MMWICLSKMNGNDLIRRNGGDYRGIEASGRGGAGEGGRCGCYAEADGLSGLLQGLGQRRADRVRLEARRTRQSGKTCSLRILRVCAASRHITALKLLCFETALKHTESALCQTVADRSDCLKFRIEISFNCRALDFFPIP